MIGAQRLSVFENSGLRRARFALRPQPPVDLPVSDTLLAGAAEVDITPPPGLPKAGYSANAHDGDGFRTRLRARVIHLRSGRSSVALVACDLLGGSAVVQHLVAEEIRNSTDVPLAGLMMGATHTHAGPGQFLGTDFYNRFGSNRAGFDPRWTRFLVERISAAVIDAVESRGPARLAWGSTPVWGLTRNRSHGPHVENETVADKRTDPQRKWVDVNPELNLLRVDRGTAAAPGDPLAALVVFSVHGTGISMKAREYNADLWAYLCGELFLRIGEAGGGTPVVGAVEGTHADVAPAVNPGSAGHVEARRIGAGVGAEAFALWRRLEGDLAESTDLRVGFREVDVRRTRRSGGVTLPERPAIGAALVAGAHENTTPVLHRIPPFRAGMPKPMWGRRDPHRHKWVLGGRFLQALIIPWRSFPHVLPVQIIGADEVALVGVPFEVTVESGRRLAAAVVEAGFGRAVVSSVANEYSGYVATAEEYARQHYEGGHTLYGPDTQRYLAGSLGTLAADVVAAAGRGESAVSDPVPERGFDLLVRSYWPPAGGDRLPPASAACEPVFTDPTRAEFGRWRWEWFDAPPGDLSWWEPFVHVERRSRGEEWAPAVRRGQVITDRGWSISVRHLGAAPERGPQVHRYSVEWFEPLFAAGTEFRFVVRSGRGDDLASEPFS